MTKLEKRTVLTRLRINHEIANPDPNDPLQFLGNELESDEDETNAKMMTFNKEHMGKTGDNIKSVPVAGSEDDQSIIHINSKEKQLFHILKRVNAKFGHLCTQIDQQNEKDDKRILEYSIIDEAKRVLDAREQLGDLKLGKYFIKKLREVLESNTELPEDIINLL